MKSLSDMTDQELTAFIDAASYRLWMAEDTGRTISCEQMLIYKEALIEEKQRKTVNKQLK